MATLSTDEFLNKKWRKFFTILDVNHDGNVTREDHAEMGRRFAAAVLVSEERKAVIRQHFITIWETVFNLDGEIETVDFPYFMDLFNRNGTEGFRKICEGVCPVMFEAVDENGDGVIHFPEFKNFFNLFYKDDSHAVKSFDIINTTKDGKLTREEFYAAFTEFLSGVDQTSPYQYFFGELDV